MNLSWLDFKKFNPNTNTSPKCYTKIDIELLRHIYEQIPIMVDEENNTSPWGIWFKQGMFNMTSKSGLFVHNMRSGYTRLYEAKLLHIYDHRWATFDGRVARPLKDNEKRNPEFTIKTRYYVPESEMFQAVDPNWNHNWFIDFRNNARYNDERTAIFSVVPFVGIGNNAPLLFTCTIDRSDMVTNLIGNLSSEPISLTNSKSSVDFSIGGRWKSPFQLLSTPFN